MNKVYIIPWGKYKGKYINELPSSYLKWLAENCEDDLICSTADNEYNIRTDYNDHWEDI